MTSAPQDASPKSLIERLEALKKPINNDRFDYKYEREHNQTIDEAIAIVREHAAAQGNLVAVLLHFANRYCPLNDDGKPEALRLIAALGEPAKASSASLSPEVNAAGVLAAEKAYRQHIEGRPMLPAIAAYLRAVLGGISARKEEDSSKVDAKPSPASEAATLTPKEKYEIADRIVTESRSKSDVVQDVFDEIAERFELRRRG